MSKDYINWDRVSELEKQYGPKIILQKYAAFEGVDPSHSYLVSDEIDIQPAWDIPRKVAIHTTIVGAMFNKRFNPNHPMTPEEIYQSAREACLAGSPSVHLHVRDKEGNSVLDPDMFHSIIDPLREEFPQIVIDGCMVSNSQKDWDLIKVCLKEKLFEMTPVNTNAAYNGDMMFGVPPFQMINMCKYVQDAGVVPWVTFFSSADVDNANRYLIKSGLLQKPYHFLVLYGLPGCGPIDSPRGMMDTMSMTYNQLKDLDPDCKIMFCSAGRASSFIATQAMLMGCDIRVGMEDSVWKYPHRNDKIVSNAEEFVSARTIAENIGREAMNAAELREYFGLEKK